MINLDHYRSINNDLCGRPLRDLIEKYREVTQSMSTYLDYNYDNATPELLVGKIVIAPYEGIYKITKIDDRRLSLINVLTRGESSARVSQEDLRIFVDNADARLCIRECFKLVRERVKERAGNQDSYTRSVAISKHSHREKNKKYGALIAHALGSCKNGLTDAEAEEIQTALNYYTISSTKRRTLFARFAELSEVFRETYFVCPDCDNVELIDDAFDTITEDTVCINCQDRYDFSSYHSTWIHTEDSRPLYETYTQYDRGDAQDYLSYQATYDEYYYEDGAYFTSEAYHDVYHGDDDEEEEDDDSGLHDYHSTYRDFVEVASDKRYVPLGVELEVYASERREVVRSLKESFDDLYLERDGSLSHEYGFEIITQPYGKTEWDTYGPRLVSHLLDRKVLGYNHPDSGSSYGIHISINRRYLSPLQEARMSLFLTADENVGFVKAIAQRNAIYGGSDTMQIGCLEKSDQTVRRVGGINRYDNKKKINGMGKYSPFNLKGDIAECRIFQSTLHPQSFMKNLEFMWALVEWTNLATATGSSWLHTDFIKWLAKRPKADQDFGNLIAYLRRPQYVVKRGSGTIRNTWLSMLPVATTKSQPTEDILEEALAA